MCLGRTRMTAPCIDGVLQVLLGVEAALPLCAVVGDIQVEEHHDPGFGVQARQGEIPTNTPTLRL